jgi:hypothetical protein
MPVNRIYRKSLCGLYYERVLQVNNSRWPLFVDFYFRVYFPSPELCMPQSYFEPFLKDELQRLDKLCGNSVLHKGFSDFWTALADAKKRSLLQVWCLTSAREDEKNAPL